MILVIEMHGRVMEERVPIACRKLCASGPLFAASQISCWKGSRLWLSSAKQIRFADSKERELSCVVLRYSLLARSSDWA